MILVPTSLLYLFAAIGCLSTGGMTAMLLTRLTHRIKFNEWPLSLVEIELVESRKEVARLVKANETLTKKLEAAKEETALAVKTILNRALEPSRG